jgi:hypothetical protein
MPKPADKAPKQNIIARFVRWFKDHKDVIVAVFTVLNVIGGGLWVTAMFLIKDVPNLKHEAVVNMKVFEGDTDESGCNVRLQVEVVNGGTAAFDVKRIRLRVWESPLLTANSGIQFLDLSAVERQKPIRTDEVKDALIIAHYALKANLVHVFLYSFPLQTRRRYDFRADVENQTWYGRYHSLAYGRVTSDRLCVGLAPSPAPSPAPFPAPSENIPIDLSIPRPDAKNPKLTDPADHRFWKQLLDTKPFPVQAMVRSY